MTLAKTALVLALSFLTAPTAEAAETTAQYCQRMGTDDEPRSLPQSLAQAAKQALGLEAPDAVVLRTTLFRCLDGAILVCTTGANLPCGRANTRRSLPSAAQYCRQNPNAPFIPAFVTGHDTIYQWQCRGAEAVAGEPVEAIDRRGFVARSWRPVE